MLISNTTLNLFFTAFQLMFSKITVNIKTLNPVLVLFTFMEP